jgi:hypothetical protein
MRSRKNIINASQRFVSHVLVPPEAKIKGYTRPPSTHDSITTWLRLLLRNPATILEQQAISKPRTEKVTEMLAPAKASLIPTIDLPKPVYNYYFQDRLPLTLSNRQKQLAVAKRQQEARFESADALRRLIWNHAADTFDAHPKAAQQLQQILLQLSKEKITTPQEYLSVIKHVLQSASSLGKNAILNDDLSVDHLSILGAPSLMQGAMNGWVLYNIWKFASAEFVLVPLRLFAAARTPKKEVKDVAQVLRTHDAILRGQDIHKITSRTQLLDILAARGFDLKGKTFSDSLTVAQLQDLLQAWLQFSKDAKNETLYFLPGILTYGLLEGRDPCPCE